MSLESAAFFRFYYLAASNNNELYEKFEFVIKGDNPITYRSNAFIPILLNTFQECQDIYFQRFFVICLRKPDLSETGAKTSQQVSTVQC